MIQRYKSQNRPYSQHEYKDLFDGILYKYNINKHDCIYHDRCGHRYLTNNNNVNCMVCYRLQNKTDMVLYDLIDDYIRLFPNGYLEDTITHYHYYIFKSFYIWLYGKRCVGRNRLL